MDSVEPLADDVAVTRGSYAWLVAFILVEGYLLAKGIWIGAAIAGLWVPTAAITYLVVRWRQNHRHDR